MTDALAALYPVHPDAFILSPAADGRSDGRWQLEGARLEPVMRGVSPSGAATWIYDNITTDSFTARLTAVLVDDLLRAAYWSIPYPTQEEQNAVKHRGDLEPGVEFGDRVAPEMAEPVALLTTALAEPARLPALYSARADHITLGSVTSEVFVGGAGRAIWTEFVESVHDFELRGPVQAELVAPDCGWMAANVDILRPPTPYRFFYVWIREADGWSIVVSHDAVSVDA